MEMLSKAKRGGSFEKEDDDGKETRMHVSF